MQLPLEQELSIMKYNAKRDFVKWVTKQSPDYFCHLTFRPERQKSLKGAKKAVERFMTEIRGCGIFGFEWGKLGGLLHTHGVIWSWWSAEDLWRWWFESYGRCKFEKFNPDMGGAEYVIKYAFKEDTLEFLGDLTFMSKKLSLC